MAVFVSVCTCLFLCVYVWIRGLFYYVIHKHLFIYVHMDGEFYVGGYAMRLYYLFVCCFFLLPLQE